MPFADENDPGLAIEHIAIPFKNGEIATYVAKPRGGRNLPAVLILHENTGTRPHFEDVARRLAREGFLVAVPDALSPKGGTPEGAEDATALIKELDRAATIALYNAVAAFLRTHADGNGRVASWGFCWGGGLSNQMAIHCADLAAAIVFYGGSPEDADVAKIRVPMMLNYGETDQRINAGVPAYEAALKAAGKPYELHMYDGAGHAFFNDTRDDRHDASAAALAWDRVLDFLNRKLTA